MIVSFPKNWIPAFAGASITYGIGFLHHSENIWYLTIFNFIGILLFYNPLSINELKLFSIKNIFYYLFLILGILISPFCATNLLQWIGIISCAIIGFSYTNNTFLNRKQLRDIPGLKLFLVVFCWIYMCFILPLSHLTSFQLTEIDLITCAIIFLTSLSCDYGDFKIDAPSRKTIPQIMGKENTKSILILSFLGVYFSLHMIERLNIFFHVGIGINFLLLIFMNENKNKNFNKIVDGSLIIWGIGLTLI
jgi:hypothetical protein